MGTVDGVDPSPRRQLISKVFAMKESVCGSVVFIKDMDAVPQDADASLEGLKQEGRWRMWYYQ